MSRGLTHASAVTTDGSGTPAKKDAGLKQDKKTWSWVVRAISASRLRSATRTIHAAVRFRRRWSLNRPLPLKDEAGALMGYVDRVVLRDGRILVEGWAKSSRIHLKSEAQNLFVEVNLPRSDLPQDANTTTTTNHGFSAHLDGTDFVVISGSIGQLCKVRVSNPRSHAIAWVRTLSAIAVLPQRHWRDLLAWFMRGDSEAGTRLERALLPRQTQFSVPLAAKNVLAPLNTATQSYEFGVDILIPVFNAHDVLIECLKRVKRFTSPEHRVILIDDASTDQRIIPLLRAFATERDGVSLLSMSKNSGFVETVNLGLGQARGEVILLNSDVLVSDGWLDRLLAPILADPTIASVTPMTNNGEIASVPNICQASELAEGAVDMIDAVARQFDAGATIVDAPTGVGFCMALSRQWLAKVSQLDTAFGRGYGEEVDWCQRVAALGGRNVLTGAVFVEHRGGMSFKEEKKRLIEEHNRLISCRYPNYDAAVQRFIRADPAVGPRLALGMAASSNGATLPIYLAHTLGGGAEYWLHETIQQHHTNGEAAVVVRDAHEAEHLQVELHNALGTTLARVPITDLVDYLGAPLKRRLIYSNLVGARAPLEIMEKALSCLLPGEELEILFHDFFPLCPSYNLVGIEGKFCGLPSTTDCQACYTRLATTSGRRTATIMEWRKRWRRILDRATEITVFSKDSRVQIAKVWPDLEPRVIVKSHEVRNLPPRLQQPRNDRLTLGVLGGIGYNKGAGVLHSLAQHADKDIDLVVIGQLDPAFNHPRIRVHGKYDRDSIGELASTYRITAWLIPSIWPETFCFAVHEALATGLHVFVFGLGAQEEAARQAHNGHVLPDGCEGETLLTYIREHVANSRAEPNLSYSGNI